MTETAIAETPALPARRHRWDDPITIANHPRTGCQETHRKCVLCSIIKITVHPPHGLPYRLWQYRDGERADGLTPMCQGESE